MADERTSLFAESRPGPSYAFPGRMPRSSAQKKMRRFQCCICASFFTVLIITLILSIVYTVSTGDRKPPDDGPVMRRPSRLLVLNASDILNLMTVAPWPMTDEPDDPWQLDGPSANQTEDALYAGIKALGDKELLEEEVAEPELNTPSFRHQRAVSTTLTARVMAKRGYVENQATAELVRSNPAPTKPLRRWSVGKGPAIKRLDESAAARTMRCDAEAKFRHSNGTCNNRMHPVTYGVAMLPFRRAMNPDYADGIAAPRKSRSNKELPSARLVSLRVRRPSYNSDPQFTVMLAVFGQFLDHDITQTALNQGQDGRPIECCIDPGQTLHPECFPVASGTGDPNFDKFNISCMSFVRSAPAPTGHFGPRQQLNQASAFIDGSVVYGTLDDRVQRLRSSENGMLRMYNTPDNRTLLPVSDDPTDGCNEAEMNAKGKYCFDAGDNRANENLHLAAMHLIWARHHNHLAHGLRLVNGDWDDERLFQEARRILAAQMQHIAYNEFLPVVLGKEFTEDIGMRSSPGKTTDMYDATVNAAIANVFAGCAFRFAHTLLPGLMNMSKDPTTTEYIELHRMLFNPYSLWSADGLDAAIGSAIGTPLAKSANTVYSQELTEKLFQTPVKPNGTANKTTRKTVGLDLVSLNIQRGRDHGLPAYSEWRRHCGLSPADSWDEMREIVDGESMADMQMIYEEAIDVDVYTGALAEPPMEGAIIGPLLSCLLTDQFMRLKLGDSFWFERPVGPQAFTKAQLGQIYGTSLAAIICRNSDAVNRAPREVMRKVDAENPVRNCVQLDTFSFEPWREEAPLMMERPSIVRVPIGEPEMGVRSMAVLPTSDAVSSGNISLFQAMLEKQSGGNNLK